MVLAFLCYLVVVHLEREPVRREREKAMSPKREEVEDQVRRIDRLFEIGLLLATILSASIMQYASAKFIYEEKLKDLDFTFKELTIPIITLILLWLIKELFPRRILKWLYLKRWTKEFCWTFLSNFLVLGILSFIIVSFTTDKHLLSSITSTMVLIAWLLTLSASWYYRKGEQESRKFSRELAMTISEHAIIFAISYFVLIRIILISNLPAP